MQTKRPLERRPDRPTILRVDVLIVGAGLSGIGAAWKLQECCPDTSFLILEAREAIGGTWDLFRYPGVRSDSDMMSLGYPFRPWTMKATLGSGGAIRNYIEDTAIEAGLTNRIRFGEKVIEADWDTEQAEWTVISRTINEAEHTYVCRFLYLCSGYYDHDQGYMPQWPDMNRFKGALIHPQAWPKNLNVANKKIIVIGSGATAVTLVPHLAREAAHVVMLQRSPSYVMSLPSEDKITNWMRSRLPSPIGNKLARWKSISEAMVLFGLCKALPRLMKRILVRNARLSAGRAGEEGQHFTPDYNPWDQRLCFASDGDFFAALRTGKASIVTDEIERVTSSGIKTRSGQEIPADIIVAATGLTIRVMGGIRLRVDNLPVNLRKSLVYRGMMLAEVPNMFFAAGYTNAAWTLRCNLTWEAACRTINYMKRHSLRWCMPSGAKAQASNQTIIPLAAGYVQRSSDLLPRQGRKAPWRLHQNYLLDSVSSRHHFLSDGVLRFDKSL